MIVEVVHRKGVLGKVTSNRNNRCYGFLPLSNERASKRLPEALIVDPAAEV